MAKLVLDLHAIYNKGHLIDQALHQVLTMPSKKLKQWKLLGKGLGSSKKVLRF